MAKIQPINYPLNLGTANELAVNININSELDGGKISYRLLSVSDENFKIMSTGTLNISEAQVTAEGFNKDWALSYAASELGITLIV